MTSIVDLYQSRPGTPSTQNYQPRPQPSRTFYYDYSEDFDNHSKPSLPRFEPIPPVAPMPTGVASSRRTTTTLGGYDAQSQRSSRAGFSGSFEPLSSGKSYCHHVELQRRKRSRPGGRQGTSPLGDSTAAPLDSLRRQWLDGNIGLGNASGVEGPIAGLQVSDTDSKDLGVNKLDHARPRRDLERQSIPQLFICNGDKTSDLPYPVSLQSVDSERAAHHRTSAAVRHARTEPASSASTHHSEENMFYSADPGLSDLASLVQHLDKVADWDFESLKNASAGSLSSSSNSPNLPPCRSALSDDHGQGKEQEPWFGGSVAGKTPDFLHGLRDRERNIAVSSINASKLFARRNVGSSLVCGRAETTVLAPQPRSPALRLRLQNSLPQIMKALPSLPSGSARSESYIPRISAEDVESSTSYPLLEPSLIDSSPTVSTGILRYQDMEETRVSRHDGTLEKIPHRISRGSGSVSVLGTYLVGCEGRASPASSVSGSAQASPRSNRSYSGKLKLRISNSVLMKSLKLSSPPAEDGPTEQHQAHAKQSALFAASNTLCNGVVAPTRFSKDGEGDSSQEFGHKGDIGGVKISQVRASSRSGYNHLQEKATAPKRRRSLVPGASASDEESCVSDGSGDGKPSRGLRKRFSNFRARLTESQLRLGHSEPHLLADGDNPTRTDVAHSQISGSDRSESEGRRTQLEGARLRERMTKWMKAAKQAVGSACTGSKKRDR